MVTTFVDDDPGYVRWLALNGRGYVVNAFKGPSVPLMLHLAACQTIRGTPTRGTNWTAEYIKICASEREELIRWAREELGADLPECQKCM